MCCNLREAWRWAERSLHELLRTVFSAPQPVWKFLGETKGGTSCSVPQVNMPFENQENVQFSSLLCA
ncbi:hypothetical protein GRJ2_001502600 [Grus japonensis]|uniref:Uncharacterized protein n=1 Tax=Grus japonensis TaxID=30415 RepID=A0ABC9WY77_GRUJA